MEESRMCFQDAPVRKPLAAVSGITVKGNLVYFDKEGSCIVPASAPEIEQIRALTRKVKNRIKLHEKRGVFVMPLWLKTTSDGDDGEQKTSFPRQGM